MQRFFHYFVLRTHFWRVIGYAELAELYASRMLRVMALQMVGGFAIVYMFQLGFSLTFIAIYWFFYFILRTLLAPVVALIIARYGPKHGTLISNVGHIMAVFILVLVPDYGIYALLVYAPIAGFAISLYNACYLVDFSKVKHVDHAGKELGIMQIVERIVTSLGPLLGGVVALFFGPQAMFIFASFLLLLSALPLFFTAEPVKVHQKITLHHFNWRVAWRPCLGNIGSGIDLNLSGIMWSLFLAVCVLGVSGNEVYAQIGALSSLSMLAVIACAYFYGKIVDNYHGKKLLKYSVIADAIIHLIRPLVGTPVQAVGVNIANEVATTGCSLPINRAIFDTADGLPGYRIVYITILGAMLSVGDAIVMAILLVLAILFEAKDALHWLYLVAGPIVLLMLFHGKALYQRGILTKFVHRV